MAEQVRPIDDWAILFAALWQRRGPASVGMLIGLVIAILGLLILPQSYRTVLVLAPIPSFAAYGGSADGAGDGAALVGDPVAVAQTDQARIDRLSAFAVSTDTASAVIVARPEAVMSLIGPSRLHRTLDTLGLSGSGRPTDPSAQLAAYLADALTIDRQSGVLRLTLITGGPDAAEQVLDRLGAEMDAAERRFARRAIERHVAYLRVRADLAVRDDERFAIHQSLDRLALATLAIEEPGPFAIEALGQATTRPRPEFPPPPAISLTLGMAAGAFLGLILPFSARAGRSP